MFIDISEILADDIAGTVSAVGPDVTKFKSGDRIFGQSNLGRGPDAAGLQQYCVLDSKVSAHIPNSISFEETATIPVNTIASFIGIFHETGLGIGFPEIKPNDPKSQKIVVIGGESSCGQYAIEFAKLAGFGEIITVASLANENKLRELGASYVVDRHGPDVVARVCNVVGDDLIYAIDPISRR